MTDYEKEAFWKALNRLYETAVEHTKQLEKDAENIRALARIADMHDRRLTRLERPPEGHEV
jgi:hypothetical protein